MKNVYPFFLLMVLFSSGSGATADNINAARYELPFTIGLGLQPTALSPHHKDALQANTTILDHVLEPLYTMGIHGHLKPLLVDKHQVEDPYNWLFTLKRGVRFHDGSELSSDDVIATFDRIVKKGKNNTYRQYLGKVHYEKAGPYQFRIKTPQPDPELQRRLVDLRIISEQFADADQETFDSGKALVGTGPYQWVNHTGLKQFELKAFEHYHASPPYLQHVIIKVITDKSARLSEFKAGKLDLIDGLSPEDMPNLLKQQYARLSMPDGDALYHISLDQHRDQSPYILDHLGQPLKKNPLKDRRVREALSKAIDRQQLIDQFYGKQGAIPTGQLVPEDFPGHMPGWKPDKRNVEQAKQLLKEAGYPQGFRLTLHDKDARKPILQAIAAMLTDINIQAQVETFPPEVYFPRLIGHEFAAGLTFYDALGSIKNMLVDMVQTGQAANLGRYSNLVVDTQLIKAASRFNPDIRYREYSYVMELAMRDYAIIPLFFDNPIWAIRKDMTYLPFVNAYTLAQHVVPD